MYENDGRQMTTMHISQYECDSSYSWYYYKVCIYFWATAIPDFKKLEIFCPIFVRWKWLPMQALFLTFKVGLFYNNPAALEITPGHQFKTEQKCCMTLNPLLQYFYLKDLHLLRQIFTSYVKQLPEKYFRELKNTKYSKYHNQPM